MNRVLQSAVCGALLIALAGCQKKEQPDPAAEAPPPAQVEKETGASLVKVTNPSQFPLAAAIQRGIAPELNVTGTVAADVSRNVPVISLASGRVIEIDARLGDQVKQGQLLMKVQSADISSAIAEYKHALADETLAHAQLDRAKTLLDKGAIAQKDVEIAQDTEDKAKVDVETASEHLRVLGASTSTTTPVIEIHSPSSGVIVEQNVTNAGGVKTLDNSPNLFTIADLSVVWVICDVYENDLSFIHPGEYAEVKLNAYPGRTFRGRVDNIGAILDPAIRTAKVRLEMPNPGMMRLGMFVTATFHGQKQETVALVPASAILHLHDRDWVYVPEGQNAFRRLEVTAGKMAPGNLQEVLKGLTPGSQVVSNALVLQSTAEQ